MNMKRYAVMGNPIEHSLSPFIHQEFARQSGILIEYERILLQEKHVNQQVMDFFATGGRGLNITLPGKERAFMLCDKVTKRCQTAGASNTLWMSAGALMGDNTDGIGLLRDLQRHVNIADARILLLGAGGAARGIIAPLLSLKPQQLTVINRNYDRACQLQQTFPDISVSDWQTPGAGYDLIVNATSAVFTGTKQMLNEQIFSAKPFCYDLSYHANQTTSFISLCQRFGCQTRDGLGMLVEQAAEAFFIWHQIKPDTAGMVEYLRTP